METILCADDSITLKGITLRLKYSFFSGICVPSNKVVIKLEIVNNFKVF
jgi:hypothetical protein